jgi:hypothetical protein
VAFRGENLSASLYWLKREKTVSKGILTSSVKSDERFHCSMIFGLMVSCFWADNPDEKPIISNIAAYSLISGKYRKKGGVRIKGWKNSEQVAPTELS